MNFKNIVKAEYNQIVDQYLAMLKEIGFHISWSKYVKDESCEDAGHLFVLAQKK